MDEQEIYHAIGQALVDFIEEDWIETKLMFEASNHSAELSGYYITYDKKRINLKISELPVNVNLALIDLHKLMSEYGSSWNKGEFTLFENHKFDVKFEYDG